MRCVMPPFKHQQPTQSHHALGVVSVLSLVLICLMTYLLVFPRVAFALKVEPSTQPTMGDPILDRLPAQAIVAQPASKREIENSALLTEINKLKAAATRTNTNVVTRGRATPPSPSSAQVQTRSAAWVLGLLHLQGMGVPQDAPQALYWFNQANQLGEPLAAAGLAWCAIDGCDAPSNPVAARAWVAQLRSIKPGRALYLEWLVETALSPLQANSADTAQEFEKTRLARRQLLVNAAKFQDVQALIELGFESIAAERVLEAQAYFQAAAPHSKVAANNAKLVVSRLGDQKALCQVNNAENLPANTLLTSAQALHRGDSCQVNYIEAIRLYNLASNKGNVIAKRMMSLIYSKPGVDGNINIAWMQQLANINISTLSPNLDRYSLPPMMQREPNGLSDLIPLYLRHLSEIKVE
jgi:TPR repeat protein